MPYSGVIMFFEQISSGGCKSYLIGCKETRQAIVVDPEIGLIDRYLAVAAREGLRIQYLLDTHTHADHFSASHELRERLGVPVIMHRNSPAPFIDIKVDDGETVIVGKLRLNILYTPGHTEDSICVLLADRILTGDTLLVDGTGRSDLPGGNAGQLYDSLFNKLLKLPPALLVFPAHDYKGQTHSTLAKEIADNPRLQKRNRKEFIELMQTLNLKMPTHLTEALRTNRSGGKSIAQLIAAAAARIAFMSIAELRHHLDGGEPSLVILDVREQDAYAKEHIPGAMNLPRGQLELRVDELLPDPTRRVLTYCEFGKISTLAAATLRDIGYSRAIALDGGFQSWRKTAMGKAD
jgi:glyoxylase-like metal-dependent hydrolase (beta-lactamase superfamily II)/rhodanese-related sulfurtransferase